MGLALIVWAQEDPSFGVRTDEETNQTIISGWASCTWKFWWTACAAVRRRSQCRAPQVAYREAIRKSPKSKAKFVKTIRGRGQYGHVWIKMEPNETGKGFEFVDAIKGGTVPREFISGGGKRSARKPCRTA